MTSTDAYAQIFFFIALNIFCNILQAYVKYYFIVDYLTNIVQKNVKNMI